MDGSTSEVQALRAELEALRAEVRELRGRRKRTTDTKSPTDDVDEDLSSRRGFLRVAGGAAIAGLIAAVGGKAESAEAATGGALLIGGASQNPTGVNDVTRMYCPGTTDLMPRMLHMDNYTTSSYTMPSDHRIAIAGTTSGDDAGDGFRTGVYGRANTPLEPYPGQGVFGSSSGTNNPYTEEDFGVVGTAPDWGTGVFGFCPTGTGAVGVNGYATEGVGVVAISETGICLSARLSGRIHQWPHTVQGAPLAGDYLDGEMIRDAAGDMFLCIEAGSPGVWRKVAASAPNYSNAGGSINMLSKPIRVLDSRPGYGAPLGNAGPLAGNTPYNMQITGTSVGGISVPAGAKGILGNLTVTQFAGPGWAMVWPQGVTQPTSSNINFTSTTATAAVANNFICGLSAAGKLTILSSVGTHAIIDIAGFVY